MRLIADFHTHSRFAMACSPKITVRGMESSAYEKGIGLLSTGDFTHGQWLTELKANLEPVGDSGLFRIKDSDSGVRFILGGEVSTIFEGNDKRTKKIHNMIALPDFESVDSLREVLKGYGSLESDGRPQLSMSAAQLVEEAFGINGDAFMFPAHAWTPYFGVLGSVSGFDSIKDAYDDQERRIFALETGLSSDPAMNWRVSALDKYTLLSNSDMHSLPKLGREANVFELDGKEITYDGIVRAVHDRDAKQFRRTLEFYPEEGKYHFDGHRECGVSVDPTTSNVSICRVCGKKLVAGVMHRVNDLADRPVGFKPREAIPYTSIVPLLEVIAYAMRKGTFSPSVESQYRRLLELGKEFDVLIETDIEVIRVNSSDEIAKAVENVRCGRITIMPGYAGVFGKVELLDRKSGKEDQARQMGLF